MRGVEYAFTSPYDAAEYRKGRMNSLSHCRKKPSLMSAMTEMLASFN